MEEGLGSQGVVHVGGQGEVLRGVEIVHPQPPLHLLDSLLGEGYHPGFLVHDVISFAPQARDELGHAAVVGIRLLSRAGDDERSACLVYQNVVHLVHDGVVKASLHLLGEVQHHVVPQVVEAELVVGAVGDVGLVGFPTAHRPQVLIALIVGHVVRVEEEGRLVLDNPHREPQEMVDGPHPLGVALGQVIVDGDQVTPLAFQSVEVEGQGGNQGLALAGSHLGHLALVQHHAAHQLHVEVAHARGALGRLPHRGESLYQKIVQGLASLEPVDEFLRFITERFIGQSLEPGLKSVDLLDKRPQSIQFPLVGVSDNLTQQTLKHNLANSHLFFELWILDFGLLTGHIFHVLAH